MRSLDFAREDKGARDFERLLCHLDSASRMERSLDYARDDIASANILMFNSFGKKVAKSLELMDYFLIFAARFDRYT